ncbi:Endoglucanase 24 [Glycine soja]|nr:Endoglucanase 24 [Glycine soja]
MKKVLRSLFQIAVFHVLLKPKAGLGSSHDYGDALSKAIIFFEGQRSGFLPEDQRVSWRGKSGLSDGWNYNTDLTGGVGDPNSDHECWERPEDMDTARTTYAVDAPNAASDVAAAAASMAFRSSDPGYSETLRRNAITAFQFADNYRGAYSDNDNVKYNACPYYCDFDGYQEIAYYAHGVHFGACIEKFWKLNLLDELLWGAAWLRRATQDDNFLNYIQTNGKTLGADDNINEFGWDNKHAGLNVLVSKEVIEGNMYSLESYKSSAESFICTLIPESPSSHIEYTPGGLVYRPGGSNLQHATSIAFLELVYANYLTHASQAINCGNVYVSAQTLRQHAKRQVDYILGDNPMGLSYMVGYSNYYPQRIHHRGSSLPSIKDHPQFIACKEGSIYYNSTNPNPNVLVGAIVGGPDENDDYVDDRVDFRKSEPTTYINAPFVGVLAYFAANPNFS